MRRLRGIDVGAAGEVSKTQTLQHILEGGSERGVRRWACRAFNERLSEIELIHTPICRCGPNGSDKHI